MLLLAQANAAAAAAAAGEEGDDADMLQLLAADGGGGVKPASSADGEEGELPEEGEAMQGVEGPGRKWGKCTKEQISSLRKILLQ